MLFDELMMKDYCLYLDAQKTYYPNLKKMNTVFTSKKQMQYACNNEFKQVLKACLR